MELSTQAFLDSVSNPGTKKCYKHGLNKFCEWYGKTAEQILELRKNDLTQQTGENLIEYRNRASRFEKEIEKFHAYRLTRGSINTARVQTLGIRQLFRYYEMPIRFRNGSKIGKTVKTTKNFPLTIDYVRKMFEVADLRERVILSTATDLGLRIGDFIALKKSDLPPLDQEPPISFDVMTTKEGVLAHGFLSQETVDLLKVYLPTLERKNGNAYLFPSNGNRAISDEWLNKLLQRLAEKAKINLGGKCISFHCFRKTFLSTAIDSGIGLTAGKKLCGKTIAQSDDTYLTTVNLRQKFIQLKKFLGIKEQPHIDTNQLEALKDAVTKLQEDLTRQKLITETISQDNLTTKEQLGKLQYLVEFVNSFDDSQKLGVVLNFLKMQALGDQEEDFRLKPIKSEFSPYIGLKLSETAKTLGISEKEALRRLFADDAEALRAAEDRWEDIEKRLKSKAQNSEGFKD
jgi:integrase